MTLPSPTVSPRIIADNLTIRYPLQSRLRQPGETSRGERFANALKRVSFRLERGARVGLLGRNGSGKSTLLRTMAGVYPPIEGSILVEGEVAAVFNVSLGFQPGATGYENIFLRGVLLGLSFKEIKALVPRILDFAGLGDWIHQPIENYSSGMALRLAFAITTSVEADILLLDEWLGAGDANFIEKARQRMSEIVERTQLLVLATHNMNLMRNICQTGMVLNQGELLYEGPVEDAITFYRELPPPEALATPASPASLTRTK